MNGPHSRPLTLLERPLPRVVPHRRRWRAVAVIVVVLVYLAGISGRWWIGNDTGLYLNLARNLLRGEGYTIAGRAHTMVPPGFPVLLAGPMGLGADGFGALNAAMCLMGLAAAGTAYLLLRELVHPDWALPVALLAALSREMVRRSGELLSDVPFALLVLAGLWLYLRGLRRSGARRGGWEAGSLLLVLSCTVRLAGAPLAAAAAIGLVLSARGHRLRAVANAAIVLALLAGAVAVGHHYYTADRDGAATGQAGAFASALTTAGWRYWLGRFAGHFYYASGQFSRLVLSQRMPLPLCMAVLIAPVVVAMVRRLRRREFFTPVVVAGYVGAILLAGVTTRYFLPLLPVLLLYLLEGYGRLFELIRRRRPASAARAMAVLMAVVLAANLPLTARTVYRRHRGEGPIATQGRRYRGLLAAADHLRRHKAPGDAAWAPQPVGYLADVPCPLPTSTQKLTRPDDDALARLFRRRRVRWVVLDVGSIDLPLEERVRDYVRAAGEPAFAAGRFHVYALDARGRPTTRPGSRPATRAAPPTDAPATAPTAAAPAGPVSVCRTAGGDGRL